MKWIEVNLQIEGAEDERAKILDLIQMSAAHLNKDFEWQISKCDSGKQNKYCST